MKRTNIYVSVVAVPPGRETRSETDKMWYLPRTALPALKRNKQEKKRNCKLPLLGTKHFNT